jgi:hypothetical protein
MFKLCQLNSLREIMQLRDPLRKRFKMQIVFASTENLVEKILVPTK